MGKPTGFLEYTRELPSKRPVHVRVKDYKEFVEFYSAEKLQQQSSRCMNCGVPFCHQGCPLGNRIPEFNDAVYRKNWKEAYELLSATNNFPEFTGRVCPAPCESACVLGINQPAVAIEEIEKHVIEIAFANGFVKPVIPFRRSGKRIAIVGSGPAGMAAASQLNHAGHLVTVFEKDDAPGGLLRYGIPDFKLEKWVVERRIKILEGEGVEFRCKTNVGMDITVDELIASYDAIILSGGSPVPRDLSIPGRDLKGVHFAMDFLTQQNKRVADKVVEDDAIIVSNKNVVVIGGGDTGSDCVGTSNRQGAISVTQFELLPIPPNSRTIQMPWPSYPMILKTSSSHEEGVTRQWSVGTKEFMGDDQGNLNALKIVDLDWQITDQGSPAQFIEVAGSEREIPCDIVLLAMGFLHLPHDGLLSQLEVAFDDKGNVQGTEKAYQTNVPKIFVAGDMRRGQSLVVWAINEGRECARKVDEYIASESSISPAHLPVKPLPLIIKP